MMDPEKNSSSSSDLETATTIDSPWTEMADRDDPATLQCMLSKELAPHAASSAYY